METKMTTCPVCNLPYARMMKHLAASHPEAAREQESLVLKYYSEGLSARQIVLQNDILYDGASSVVRLLSKHFSAEELEAGRKSRIGKTFKQKYADGELEHVKAINTARNQSEEGRAKNSEGLKLAYATGDKLAWNAGSTKLSDPRILAQSTKMSTIMRDKAAAGDINTLFQSGVNSPKWKGGISKESGRSIEEFSTGDRNHILRAGNFSCASCGKTADQLKYEKDLLKLPRWGLECDHIVPIVAGGAGQRGK